MITLPVLVAPITLAGWICLSPARTAIAALWMAATHPALTIGVTTAVAGALLAVGAVITWHNLRGSGWHLVTFFDHTPVRSLA